MGEKVLKGKVLFTITYGRKNEIGDLEIFKEETIKINSKKILDSVYGKGFNFREVDKKPNVMGTNTIYYLVGGKRAWILVVE